MRGGGKNLRFLANKALSAYERCEIKPIYNRKSYTVFRLPPNSITLDELER